MASVTGFTGAQAACRRKGAASGCLKPGSPRSFAACWGNPQLAHPALAPHTYGWGGHRAGIQRVPLHICWHSQCNGAAASHTSGEQEADGVFEPYDERNFCHRVLLAALRPLGIIALSKLLDEKIWVACVVFALGCAAGASQALAALSQVSLEAAYRIACTATWATYILSGIPMLVELLFAVTAGHVDTHVLMTLAVLGTLGMGHAGEGALLLALFTISHTLEHYLTERAQGDMSSLFSQVPSEATIIPLRRDGSPDFGKESTSHTSDVAVGAHILVRPGEQVPLDSEVVHGRSLVSMEHITGESLPAPRGLGDELPAGARNHDGALVVRALRASSQSTPARIARLTLDAQSKRPQLGKWLDTFGGAYSKAVLAATLATLLLLPCCGIPWLDTAAQRGAVYRAMGVLTVASPCALVVVPCAYIAAIACISFRGMLVKGGRVLDALAQCSTVALDKTGTLTQGQLTCTGMLQLEDQPFAPQLPAPGMPANAWVRQLQEAGRGDDLGALGVAMALSVRSRHPIAESVAALRAACEAAVPLPAMDNFHLEAGAGVQGTLHWQGHDSTAVFGSAEYVCQSVSDAHGLVIAAAAGRLTHLGSVSVLVIKRNDLAPSAQQPLIRFFTFTDMVHAQSLAAVHALQTGSWHNRPRAHDKLSVIMLTGDTEASARRIAQATGIDNVAAQLSPEQKLRAIQRAREKPPFPSHRGPGVIMVGDGINDAPALAAADVGVAVTGTMSDAAAATADVLLLRGDGIAGLPLLLRIAQRTQRILKQNLALAIGSIAVLALPMLLGAIPLWVAVACHEGSTLLVVLNSLRLLRAPSPVISVHARASAQASGGQSTSGQNGVQHKLRPLISTDPLSSFDDGALAGMGAATVTPLNGGLLLPAR